MACPSALRAGPWGASIACMYPLLPYKIGLRAGGQKAHGQRDGAFLDWARESVSGDVAAAELSAGPSRVLAAVDNRRDKRMLSAGLDHDPPHDDSTALWGRLQTALAERA